MKMIYNMESWSNTVTSNLVYPLDQGWFFIAQLDKEWVKSKLRKTFGKEIEEIGNKYVVEVSGNLSPIMITNHDGKYWLIQKA